MRGLQARGISVRFGRLQVLDDVTLPVRPGQAVMLVGPNGAGKTTLIKVLLGLVHPDFAVFEMNGKRAEIDNDWKRRMGYLPEAVAFSGNLSGVQLLRFFASARGVPRGRVDEVLRRVGLVEAGRRNIRGYSRGMRQRLGLGVAILAEPDLLVLDEPTSGLDQEGLSLLWSVIAEWREAGRMVLASTHDLALMERRMDEICVLREGRVLAHGTVEDLRHSARLPHRIWLEVGQAPDAKVELLCEAMRKWGKGRIERVGDRVLAEVPSDETLALVEIQSGFPGVVRGVRVEEPTLDAVYDKLLGAA
ncbi:MAG: ABC transporter ATP-binding protein [Deltaproteobacteria bacterium]|nr:ABC transporter ATP-binding protein [Deltaproteobacteria bacterium]MBW2359361.1 ABC transporter ATP-binding protein [Deltaproteobacteria bacterium]